MSECSELFFESVFTGAPKWIPKWRGHGTLKSIVDHHDWSTSKY